MVILGKWKNKTLSLSIKPNNLTISLDGVEDACVLSYDRHGRLWTAMLRQVSFRRGLDGKIVAKWLTANGQRGRRGLSSDENHLLLAEAQSIVVELLHAIECGEIILSPSISPADWVIFQNAANFSPETAAEDGLRYHTIYKPVGILPPDQYMAVVLQLTEGCAFNTCTFCTFYRDRPFRIKQLAEFRSHMQAIRNFLGDGLSLRRTIFLGDANALVVPTRQLIPLLEQVNQEFDVDRLGGIYAFLDGFSGEKKSQHEYQMLADLGLKRVYIGLESGDAGLLQFLNKPGNPGDAVNAVRSMKKAGIAVGIIILLGAGGHHFEADHVRETIRVLNEMPLDADDLIYFSELIESEGMPYVQAAYAHQLQPLTSDERIQQGLKIEEGLIFSDDGGTPHISRYDIREFVY